MEFKIEEGFIDGIEFSEGVRALLIDRDNNPKWRHKSVFEIKPEEIRHFFDRTETINLDITKYTPPYWLANKAFIF